MQTDHRTGISGFVLKMIAVVTMLIDHASASILLRMLQMGQYIPQESRALWINIYHCLRGVGRMAFPIYCFLLVEGFLHTHSRMKYARNLFLFAILSEFPFDMALENSWLDPDYNNVYWELLLGLAMLCLIGYIDDKIAEKAPGRFRLAESITFFAIAFGTGAIAEYVLKCDYGMCGILAIYVMYILYNKRELAFAVGVAILGLMSSPLEFAALLMIVPVHFYNGTRGKQMKYFFYFFYPVHLILLAGICGLLGLGI